MVIRIIPPDEAKKQARANVAAWKRGKAIRAAKAMAEPEKAESPGHTKVRTSDEQEALNRALLEAMIEGKTEYVRELLEKGADVNTKDVDGGTALMRASSFGHTKTVELLLDKGADINAKDDNGWTALMEASCAGRAETAQLLLENGADAKVKNNDAWTALMLAINNGHNGIEFLLRKHGATK